MHTLQLAFEREGLEFASFLRDARGSGGEYPTITDALREALIEQGHGGRHGQLVGDGAFAIVRGVLYSSNEDERLYLQRLSRTYTLLFTLNTEPRLLEFFQSMAGTSGSTSAPTRSCDALMALAVYGLRRYGGESSRVTEFGWGSWWLTGETAIMRFTRDIVRERKARYIMRPDFLLNFLTLAPSARVARQAFAAVFPSMLGIRLARRMPAIVFDKIIDKMAEAEALDDARRTVEISKLMNRLKSDFAHRDMATRSAWQIAPVDAVAARDIPPTRPEAAGPADGGPMRRPPDDERRPGRVGVRPGRRGGGAVVPLRP